MLISHYIKSGHVEHCEIGTNDGSTPTSDNAEDLCQYDPDC